MVQEWELAGGETAGLMVWSESESLRTRRIYGVKFKAIRVEMKKEPASH